MNLGATASTGVALVKGPCLVLVIKWQSKWTNICLCEIHKKLVHTYKCDEWAYRVCDMTWSHVAKWRRSRQGLASMDRLQVWRASQRLWSDVPHMAEKLEQRLGVDGQGQWWRASKVVIDEPIRSRDDIKRVISFGDWLVHVLHRHQRRWNGMCKAKV